MVLELVWVENNAGPAFKPISLPREIDKTCETRNTNFGINFYLDQKGRSDRKLLAIYFGNLGFILIH